jgi:hypothetical protein
MGQAISLSSDHVQQSAALAAQLAKINRMRGISAQ